MEAYRIDRFGSVDGIVLRSSEDPRPGLKEILVRVRASSLNYRDLMVLKGDPAYDKRNDPKYHRQHAPSLRRGLDGVGREGQSR